MVKRECRSESVARDGVPSRSITSVMLQQATASQQQKNVSSFDRLPSPDVHTDNGGVLSTCKQLVPTLGVAVSDMGMLSALGIITSNGGMLSAVAKIPPSQNINTSNGGVSLFKGRQGKL